MIHSRYFYPAIISLMGICLCRPPHSWFWVASGVVFVSVGLLTATWEFLKSRAEKMHDDK